MSDFILAQSLLIGLIAIALVFDFLNGLHDAANSIATIVSTRVLPARYAVFWAAFFNFIAFLFFGLHVAQTLGTGIVEPSLVDARVTFAALSGAIVWNVVTWLFGIPLQLLSCSGWRACRRRRRKSGDRSRRLERPVKNRGGNRAFSVSGICSRVVAGSGGIVGLRAVYAVCRRQQFSKASVPVGFALLARAWRERRAENHGDYRGPFISARILPRQLSCPFLGCDLLSGGYGSRHASRRLADRPNHRDQYYWRVPCKGSARNQAAQ